MSAMAHCDTGSPPAWSRSSSARTPWSSPFWSSARALERASRHKHNPNCSSLGSRGELVDRNILTNQLPSLARLTMSTALSGISICSSLADLLHWVNRTPGESVNPHALI